MARIDRQEVPTARVVKPPTASADEGSSNSVRIPSSGPAGARRELRLGYRQPPYAPCSSAAMAGALDGPTGDPLESANPISRCGPVEMPTIPEPTSDTT